MIHFSKQRVALLSVGSNTLLVCLKFLVGLLTGSVSIVSEAIHSMMDLAAAVIAFTSVRLSGRPADAGHPFGHEKFENVSGVIEGLLIVAAAGWIMWEAVHKLISPTPVDSIHWGFIVMFISAVVNMIVSRELYKVARREKSVALEADALHLKADVITSAGVGVGLLLLLLTGWAWLDPVVAILVAVFILHEAWELIRRAFAPLIDSSITAEELTLLEQALRRFSGEFLGYHELRTRQSGRLRHIDFHIILHKDIHLQQAHELCDRLEDAITDVLPDTHVLIHPECCGEDCHCRSLQIVHHDATENHHPLPGSHGSTSAL